MLAAPHEEAALDALKTPTELGESLIRRRHQIAVLELMWSVDAARFLRTKEYEREGFNTAYDYLRVNCHLTAPQVIERCDIGEQLDKIPQTVMAMMEGEIGFGHVVAIAKTADALAKSPTASPFDEAPALKHAREETVGRLHYTCLHLRHALDPQGYAKNEAEVVDMRSLEIKSGGDGMASVNGFLDSAGAAALRQALEPLAKRSGKDDRRKRDRRLADALVELASGARPAQLQVTASLETLMGLAGAPAGEMEFSLPIGARTIERIACDCSVVRVLLGADSAVIDVGRSKRIVGPAQKRALVARDGGCRWPGCDRSALWSEAHHLVYWINGGSTELDNLVLLCYRHHRMVHEGNWQLVKCEDGRLLTIPPATPMRSGWARGPD
jgi:hypothetical protein